MDLTQIMNLIRILDNIFPFIYHRSYYHLEIVFFTICLQTERTVRGTDKMRTHALLIFHELASISISKYVASFLYLMSYNPQLESDK